MLKQLSLIVEEKEDRSVNWKLWTLRTIPVALSLAVVGASLLLNCLGVPMGGPM